jgi:hypothetical protein
MASPSDVTDADASANGTSRVAVLAAVMLAGLCSIGTGQTEKPAATGKTAKRPTQAEKPAPAAKPELKVDDRKRFQPFGYQPHEHEITIAGQARNEEGEPVVGACVFVVPVIPNGVPIGKRTVLAQGKTDAAGHYRF